MDVVVSKTKLFCHVVNMYNNHFSRLPKTFLAVQCSPMDAVVNVVSDGVVVVFLEIQIHHVNIDIVNKIYSQPIVPSQPDYKLLQSFPSASTRLLRVW
jgi:hypothetical protein